MENNRTDDQIFDEVNTGLANNSSFDESGIEVEVRDGEVFLSGFIDSWESRRSAEDIAGNVSGVNKVHNHLELRPRDRW